MLLRRSVQDVAPEEVQRGLAGALGVPEGRLSLEKLEAQGESSSRVVLDVAGGVVQPLAMRMGQLVGQQLGGCQLLQAGVAAKGILLEEEAPPAPEGTSGNGERTWNRGQVRSKASVATGSYTSAGPRSGPGRATGFGMWTGHS